MDYWGLAVTVTKFLHVEPTLMRGGASSPFQVQLRCALVGYAGDRGSVPSLKGAHVFVGSLQVSRDAGSISFHRHPQNRELLLRLAGAAILRATIRGRSGTLRVHQGIRRATPRGRSVDGAAFCNVLWPAFADKVAGKDAGIGDGGRLKAGDLHPGPGCATQRRNPPAGALRGIR